MMFVIVAESAASVNASLYIIQSICLCDVRVKLEAVRQVTMINNKVNYNIFQFLMLHVSLQRQPLKADYF